MLSWARYIRDVSEQRRKEAAAQGEIPSDIRGVSNYERAELRESAHRAMKVTPLERWIGRTLFLGVPAIILTFFFIKAPF